MNINAKKIIVFAGPSGVGKSTLAKVLLDEFNSFEFSVSATTRSPRDEEENGIDYHFLTTQEFQEKIHDNEFIEYEEVYPGRHYGTLKNEIDRISHKNKIAIFDIDVLGAINIKKIYKDQAYVIFVKPESIDALLVRLRDRGTENEEQIQVRKNRFKTELSFEDKFDCVLVNKTREIDAAKNVVRSIVKKYFI